MDLTEMEKIEFEQIIKETDKAHQVKFDSETVVWVPKSQSRIINKTIYLPEWMAQEKGLVNGR